MIGNYLSCIGNGIKKMMSEDTEKLLKRQISELTSRVDELESIVIDPFDCLSRKLKRRNLTFNLV